MCVRGHVCQKFYIELKMFSTEVFFMLELDSFFLYLVYCFCVCVCVCVFVCMHAYTLESGDNKHLTFRQLDGEVYLVVILHMKHTL